MKIVNFSRAAKILIGGLGGFLITSSATAQTPIPMGTATNPDGHTVTVDSRSLRMDGRPVIPVMGELHYSRVPANEWLGELQKMKAGGIDIVATYVFWNHHEEEEGQAHWEAQRNLRRFVQLCADAELKVIVRIGPFAHGEAREGGFPDWMVAAPFKLRSNDKAYLEKVRTWYGLIYKQIDGLLWKDGGPVIGIQIENEYRGRWEHIATLKKMAVEAGFDVPIYTRTGWPAITGPSVYGELLPLYGDYPDGFWARPIADMPGNYPNCYVFRSQRNSTVIATEQLPKQSGEDTPAELVYPYLTCELGGGMMPSYQRRVNISPMDIYAMSLIKVGCGSNLPGYYMYHGGTNPDGDRPLNEDQTGKFIAHNDLPVKTYDFQAPVGEFGQLNGQYHLLRAMHLFLHDFGERLQAMPPVFPKGSPTEAADTTSLRWNYRTNGRAGFAFVNNYQRLKTLSEKRGVQFHIDENGLTFPAQPINVPSGAAFFFPFNLTVADATLEYATAQPIALIGTGRDTLLVLGQIEGIAPEISLIGKDGKRQLLSNLAPSHQPVAEAGHLSILLLSPEEMRRCYVADIFDQKHLFITASGLTTDSNNLMLENVDNDAYELLAYPTLKHVSLSGLDFNGHEDGIFTSYSFADGDDEPAMVRMVQTKAASSTLRTLKNGKADIVLRPDEADFAGAAEYDIEVQNYENKDLILRIPYVGDVARLYIGNHLVDDNFYNGKPFELGLKRYEYELPSTNGHLTLRVLPLQRKAAIYLQAVARPKWDDAPAIVNVQQPTLHLRKKIALKIY